eukprot:CAMPEP_0116152178 /NCGR_PEP_ID=MMETSP0329-20121206/20509_1 /TAXON_ID=697910 /ORGANISM="Pseudo-nitzschia arenysensis, Strain B593" /LENGTH=1144 /DNA_ID=CAMNT_0003648875 /DNA_START=109 /DNA_END=3543 /DNA_ORIENTATION=-
MASPSVVLVQSSSPRRDYDVLRSALPQRFLSQENENGQILSFVATTTSSASKRSSKNECCESILIIPNPALLLSNNKISNRSTSGKKSVNTAVSAKDDNEFETVPLTRSSASSKTNHQNTPAVVPITSFANFILASSDEIVSMTKIIKKKEGLMVLETVITMTNGKVPLAKFVLPGGCLVTLSTAPSWTSQEARRMTTEFMTDIEPIIPQSVSGSGSVSTASKSSTMRRTLSMPDMVPPVVTTNTRRQQNIIPSLQTNILSLGGSYQPLPLNAQTAIPVETELFKGKLLLICKPSKDPAKVDPYWNEKIFSKKKRRVIMQLQGKFKYKPTGTIYAGMEISDPMKLGLIANGLCNLILKMIRTPTLHYSFGSSTEKAHICFPASTFFETMVVTPPGEKPPEMGGIDFEGESPEARIARKAYKTKIDWNTNDTYSMGFHSMYVDFPTWSIVSLPTGRDVPLQMFWANSFASIVMYEFASEKKEHTIGKTKYVLGVQLKPLGENGDSANNAQSSSAAALEQQISGSDEEDGDETWGSEMGGEESIESAGGVDTALMPALDEEDEDEVDTSMFFDTIESLPGDDGSVNVEPMNNFSASSHNNLLNIIDSFCPCWIEMFSKRGKYATLYAFCGSKRSSSPFFRTEDMVGEIFEGNWEEDAEIDDRFSHRISDHERTRRTFGFKYAEAHTMNYKKTNTNKKIQLRRFHKLPCRFDTTFLKQRKRQSTATKLNGDKSGIIARAMGDRHWKEERMVLNSESGDVIFHHMDGSKIHFRIMISSIINVSPFPHDKNDSNVIVPLPSYHYLQIETFVRVTILMFSSEEERDSWLELLENTCRDRSERLYASELLQFEIPVDDFLSKSTMWNCQKRKILNNRRYSFRTPKAMSPEDTVQLAERALTKVLALKPKGPNDSELREFLDCVAALKEADAHSLSEEEKCAFFLNIYHIMIMHSYIILGPPSSGSEWISYFNNAAYQCSDDIFSLAELEHNIIRAEMCYPSNFLSRFVLPKSQYHFALVRPDFRLNFALNSGSLSMPTSVVPVYKATLLNEQLNNTTKEFVGYTVHVKQKGKSNDIQVSLPRLCQWFTEDFGPSATASDVVIAIEPYLSKEKRDALRLIWNSNKKSYEIGIFSLKYLSFNYECRFLTASVE